MRDYIIRNPSRNEMKYTVDDFIARYTAGEIGGGIICYLGTKSLVTNIRIYSDIAQVAKERGLIKRNFTHIWVRYGQ